MVGPVDFNRVKSNEAYMLVYSIRKTMDVLPPSKKVVVGAEVGDSKMLNNVNIKTQGQTISSLAPSGGIINQKNQKIDPQGNKRTENGVLSTMPRIERDQSVKKDLSNMNGIHDLKNASIVARFDSTTQLKRSMSHPLFGPSVQSPEQPKLPDGPSWYNQGNPQLTKRKPEDSSSKASSTKKLVKLQNSGWNKLKDMRRRVKYFTIFHSTPVSRVNSLEVVLNKLESKPF